MGLTIHYSGKLRSENALPGLMDEAGDLADAWSWHKTIFRTEFPGGSFSKEHDRELYGICISPPGCEAIFLTFTSTGHLIAPLALRHAAGEGISYGAHTKTTGAETHKLIIGFMDRISTTYFESFRLDDETRYWETRDEERLKGLF